MIDLLSLTWFIAQVIKNRVFKDISRQNICSSRLNNGVDYNLEMPN